MEFGYFNEKKYQKYIDSKRPVRIIINGISREGIIKSIVDGKMYLLPGIVYENLPTKNGGTETNARIEKKLPIEIDIPSIKIVEPLSKGYLEKLVEKYNLIENSNEKIKD